MDAPRQTEVTLQLLEDARRRLDPPVLGAAVLCAWNYLAHSHVGHIGRVVDSLPAGHNWAIPKVLATTTVAMTTRAFGCLDIASTAFGEATHTRT